MACPDFMNCASYVGSSPASFQLCVSRIEPPATAPPPSPAAETRDLPRRAPAVRRRRSGGPPSSIKNETVLKILSDFPRQRSQAGNAIDQPPPVPSSLACQEGHFVDNNYPPWVATVLQPDPVCVEAVLLQLLHRGLGV